MHFFKKILYPVIFMAATVETSSAFTIHGEYYDLTNVSTLADAQAAISGGPQLEFDTDKLEFGRPNANPTYDIGTVDEFLTGMTATITNRFDNDLDDGIGFDHYMGESLWRFTGTALLTNGEILSVTSDDGFEAGFDLDRDGVFEDSEILSSFDGLQPPGSAWHTDPFAGQTGTYQFEFFYFEGHETQAQLISNLVPGAPINVPEPGSLALLGLGLAGLGFSRRNRKP